jgi:Big-like domain-containing protein
MPRLLLAIAILGAVLAGCSKHATETAGPGARGTAPALLATQPAARSPSAVYDSEIWAQFDRPLDGRTVTPLSVFLKLDGQRVPITVSYDGITRRVFLHPTIVLQLQRTYTVEFSTNIRSLDGTPLPEGVFFQFTTNSLRRIAYDYPITNDLEGPVACLGWGGSKGLDGNIFYDVYTSDDSVAVARRTTPVLQHSVFTRYLSATAWPLGARVYWAVTSENLTTHERMNGEVNTFRVLDGSTPLESMVIKALDHGSNSIRNSATNQSCNTVVLPSGPSWNAGIHWNYLTLPDNIRIASVTMELFFIDILAGNFNGTKPSVWMAQNDWLPCVMRGGGPPFIELSGLLANAAPFDDHRNDFTSDRLSAFIEAQYRHRTLLPGTLIRTLTDTNFNSPILADQSKVPQIVVRFYRLP